MSLLAFSALPAGGQGAHHEHRWRVAAGAHVVPLLTRATPTAGAQSLTEGYLSQPILTAELDALGGHVVTLGMLNLEGWTLARGELTTGTYGEGFVDRRHPHSYVHELMAAAQLELDGSGHRFTISLAGGRGFAPFGSDDPMARPFVKYPVNHHLAQILERLVVVGAIRVGAVTVEAGAFNGDEPTSPSSSPAWSRFGDSWSARATVTAARGFELGASVARVESPEFREGFGLDQRKVSAVGRYERSLGGTGVAYALAEWARTHDDRRGRTVFTYSSFLVEGSLCRRGGWAAARFERTTRPEEERQFDPFRTPRPHIEVAILGRTQWTSVSVASGSRLPPLRALSVEPFLEATYSRARTVDRLAALRPVDLYGSERTWLLSAGARVNLGSRHRRMGRYGAAISGTSHDPAASYGHHGHQC